MRVKVKSFLNAGNGVGEGGGRAVEATQDVRKLAPLQRVDVLVDGGHVLDLLESRAGQPILERAHCRDHVSNSY